MTIGEQIPVVEGLFAQTTEGPRLLGSRCQGCGVPCFPRSPVCRNPECREQIVNLLIGNVFRVPVDGLFDAMAGEVALPASRRLLPVEGPS